MLMLLSVHVTSVLFLVFPPSRFGRFKFMTVRILEATKNWMVGSLRLRNKASSY